MPYIPTNSPLSSSELGNLWQAYREKSMVIRTYEYFIEKASEPETKEILQKGYTNETNNIERIKTIFKNAGAVIPIGFTDGDVDKESPQLFDDNYVLMYTRMMAKVLTGLYSLHLGMSYRLDICSAYMDFGNDTQDIYTTTTQLLIEKGALTRPPIISMPKETGFVEGTSYTSGLNPFKKRRVLNTVEIGLVYQSLETNITGMQLMRGFEQVAKEPDCKEYFQEGKELAKEVITIMSKLLLDSDIPAPSSWAGVITNSSIPPFSDKLMMYNTNLLSMFGLGSNSIGVGFSFRSDLLLKMGDIARKTYAFSKKGGEILMRHGWMEEPPATANHTKS